MSLVSLDWEPYSASNELMLYQNASPNAFTEGVFVFIGGQTDLTEDRFRAHLTISLNLFYI